MEGGDRGRKQEIHGGEGAAGWAEGAAGWAEAAGGRGLAPAQTLSVRLESTLR